jgi:hypothetical protein
LLIRSLSVIKVQCVLGGVAFGNGLMIGSSGMRKPGIGRLPSEHHHMGE